MKFWVGRVPFRLEDEGHRAECALCKRRVAPERAAAHAHSRHKSLAGGVLAGQLGLPETRTPDVPR